MMDSSVKAAIKQEYQQHEKDTGSVEVQVALLTKRVQELTTQAAEDKRRLIKYLADTRGLAPAETAGWRYLLEHDNNRVETIDERYRDLPFIGTLDPKVYSQ